MNASNHLFGAVVLFGMSLFFGVLTVRGLITGRFIKKYGGYVERDESPKYFAFFVICYSGLALYGLYGAIRMLLMSFAQ